MGRKKEFRWRWRVAAFALLVATLGAIYAWWEAQHWTPSREAYPVQGVFVSVADGELDFRALAATGASFAYIEASEGERGRDPMLGANLRALAESGMPFGVVHGYNPCIAADRQAGNFVTIVPRDASMLPPVIALDALASDCADPVSEAAVESELTTFLNQVEGHTGQRVILKVSQPFEKHYGISSQIERDLWLERAWLEPEYAGRPWTLWTANPALWTDVTSDPVRWVVAQP